jgi:hypothetical protein
VKVEVFSEGGADDKMRGRRIEEQASNEANLAGLLGKVNIWEKQSAAWTLLKTEMVLTVDVRGTL